MPAYWAFMLIRRIVVSAYRPRRYTVSACRPYTVGVYLFIYLSSVGWLVGVCCRRYRPFLGDRLWNGCLAYSIGPLICLSCLSFVSVCDVGALWPNGWMNQDATWYWGRPRPRRHCFGWGPRSPIGKGHNFFICCYHHISTSGLGVGASCCRVSQPLGSHLTSNDAHRRYFRLCRNRKYF